jgi:aldehyde dehydrogenase (NAD+)
MHKFADLIDKNATMLGEWESKSMGQPVGIATWVYSMVSQTFRYVTFAMNEEYFNGV